MKIGCIYTYTNISQFNSKNTGIFTYIYIYKEFPLEWGFKLNVGSKPPFSDSGILKKSPESENGGLRRIWNPHWFWKPHSSEICLYINLTSIHVIRADKKRRNILLQIHYWFWFCHLCMFTSCSCYWNFKTLRPCTQKLSWIYMCIHVVWGYYVAWGYCFANPNHCMTTNPIRYLVIWKVL